MLLATPREKTDQGGRRHQLCSALARSCFDCVLVVDSPAGARNILAVQGAVSWTALSSSVERLLSARTFARTSVRLLLAKRERRPRTVSRRDQCTGLPPAGTSLPIVRVQHGLILVANGYVHLAHSGLSALHLACLVFRRTGTRWTYKKEACRAVKSYYQHRPKPVVPGTCTGFSLWAHGCRSRCYHLRCHHRICHLGTPLRASSRGMALSKVRNYPSAAFLIPGADQPQSLNSS